MAYDPSEHEVVFPNIGYEARVPSRTPDRDADREEAALILREGSRAVLRTLRARSESDGRASESGAH